MDFSSREAFAVREFCARYGICRQTFYDEVKRGRIKAKKLGKKTVILRSDAGSGPRHFPRSTSPSLPDHDGNGEDHAGGDRPWPSDV